MERAQRRLAAIVATDVAGYSRLISRDEEGTLRALRAHRVELFDPLISDFGGRIANTAGDSMLVEFPSVVDAVRCAVAVQQGLSQRNKEVPEDRRIALRIGVNLGDVVADGTDLLGDGVNIAARLEAICQPGGLMLSDDAYRQVRDRIDLPFDDAGEHTVKNISRPVQAWRWSMDAGQGTVPPRAGSGAKATGKSVPVVAVLPFNNLGGSQDATDLCEGLSEDAITELSRQNNVKVIARNTMFGYRNKTINIRDVGRDLHADYVVEGSVRISGTRVRVTAQLIESGEENHVWAERYDRNSDDIFELQDELARRIAIAVSLEIFRHQRESATETGEEELSVEQLQRLGQKELYKFSPEGLASSRHYYSRALALEPNNHSLNVSMCWAYALDAAYGYTSGFKHAGKIALDYALKATDLNAHSYVSHHILGFAYASMGDHLRGQQALRRSLEMNPNNTDAMMHLADSLVATGQYEEGLALSAKAMELSNEPGFYHHNRGQQLMYAGRYDEAIAEIGKYISGLPGVAELTIAMCLYATGRADEAQAYARKFRELASDYLIEGQLSVYRMSRPETQEKFRGILADLGFEVPDEQAARDN